LTATDPVYDLVAESDCMVAVGFDVVELVKPWSFEKPLIWVAPWANQDPRLDASCELVGDMSAALFALADIVAYAESAWGAARVAEFLGQLRTVPPPDRTGRMSPQTVLRVMRSSAGRDAFLAVDVGAHKIFSSLAWPTYEPNRFLLSNGLSSMSYALPAAIGAAMAAPGSQVLCLTGDAGLGMNMGELGALSERNLPVVVIVLNDGAIDLIRSHQRRAGKPVFATEFGPPDHAQIGAAFGLAARRVDNEKLFSSALDEFLAAQRPALIEVMLDPAGYPTTPKSG
jgi:acetolactate synthase-1/2/3 large subunit